MRIDTKATKLSGFELILKKVKKLKTDTIYTYGVFRDLRVNPDKLRTYISRMADRGVIIKTSRGHFYKPRNLTPVKRATREVKLNKKLFGNDLFWNVKDGFPLQTETLLHAYLTRYTRDDLMGLYLLFGYTRLVEESLKLYKKRTDSHYQKIRRVLMEFEKLRMGS